MDITVRNCSELAQEMVMAVKYPKKCLAAFPYQSKKNCTARTGPVSFSKS